MTELITRLGFERNSKNISGFKPHYRKGNDLLFLIHRDYGPKKIYGIGKAFEFYEGNVYGVLTPTSPRAAAKDWVTASKVILLQLDPMAKGQWKEDGTDIEFVPTTI